MLSGGLAADCCNNADTSAKNQPQCMTFADFCTKLSWQQSLFKQFEGQKIVCEHLQELILF